MPRNSARELTDAEAARVERDERDDEQPDEQPESDDDEQPEGDDDEQPDEQPESDTPQQLTEAQVEALFASLNREGERHAREVEKRAGPMWADLTLCPCCEPATPGFVFNAYPPQVAQEKLDAVMAALGFDTGAQYDEADDKQTCVKCHGYGLTRTGSRVAGQSALPCAGCNGTGWTPKLHAAPQFAAPAAPYNIVTPPEPTPTPDATADPWGRPLGHPHYNLHPAEVAG